MSEEHHHYSALTALSEPRRLTPAENRVREIRMKAIESLLTEKGMVTPERLDAVINAYENDIGPLNGAKVVARAWVDSAYKERLLNNGAAAVAELGFGGLQGERLLVVENTPSVHNVMAGLDRVTSSGLFQGRDENHNSGLGESSVGPARVCIMTELYTRRYTSRHPECY